jgi:anthranilate 1,2-dioxygenase small subunit
VTPSDRRAAIERLLADYAWYIDQDRLEEWLDFFTEDAVYKIVPRENVEQGLPLTLFIAENKNMLRDRVVSLRRANIYNIHYDRHLLSAIRVVADGDAECAVEASFAVFHTDQEGESRIFSVGAYRDKIVFVGERALIKEKIVVVDTAAVRTLLSTPL